VLIEILAIYYSCVMVRLPHAHLHCWPLTALSAAAWHAAQVPVHQLCW
jgi:hypothetical protein